MKRLLNRIATVGLIALALCGCSGLAKSPQGSEAQQRAVVARQMFEARCREAGERIYRTEDDVDGVFLLRLRPDEYNLDKQFALDDPYGRDIAGKGYIETFLHGWFEATHVISNPRSPQEPPHVGYRYVEAVDPSDGRRYRYTGAKRAVRQMNLSAPGVQRKLARDPNFDTNVYDFVVDRVPAPGEPPRYGVTYQDISTREEREHWIAGSSLKVIDTQTQEVLAERIGYMMDPGQGNRSGGRSPWLLAADHACPAFPAYRGMTGQTTQTEIFVEKVLRPSRS